MTKISVPLYALIIFCIFLAGCQKDAIENDLQPLSEKTSLEDLKAYYQRETVSSLKDTKEPRLISPAADSPEWENALFSREKSSYIIPVRTSVTRVNKNLIVTKYLLITETNAKKSGYFYYAIGDKMKTNKAISPQEILNSISPFDDVPPGIKKPGYTLVKAPINETELFLKKSDKNAKKSGKYISQKKSSKVQQADTGGEASFAPFFDCSSAGGTVVTIDWYFQTYHNGVLVDEIYLYSTTECVGISGGDGGGGGGTSCYNEIDALNILNSVSLSNPNILTYEYGIQTKTIEMIREPKNSTWEYCKVNALGIPSLTAPRYSARFKGIRFKYTSPLRDPWKWAFFEYDRTVQTGGIIPACFTITLSPTVSSLPTSDKLKAIVVIDYTVNISVSYGGLGGQVPGTYSNSVNTNIYANG